MKGKHTPGPWKCDKDPICGDWYVRQDPENWNGMSFQYICSLPADKKGTHYGNMFKANAYLIAAAPELLEALKVIVDNCKRHMEEQGPMSEEDMWDPDYVSPLEIARRAIAKAEGKEVQK